jgi:hypothetical protein
MALIRPLFSESAIEGHHEIGTLAKGRYPERANVDTLHANMNKLGLKLAKDRLYVKQR